MNRLTLALALSLPACANIASALTGQPPPPPTPETPACRERVYGAGADSSVTCDPQEAP